MVVSLKAHFDGKVIVPDEPVDLPTGQSLDVHVTVPAGSAQGTPGSSLMSFAGTITPEDADAMMKAIDEGCERVDPSEW